MDDNEFDRVLALTRAYHREALRCRDAKAYLAACVMLGAAIEAQLVAMVECFPDEVRAVGAWPQWKKGTEKPPSRWTTF